MNWLCCWLWIVKRCSTSVQKEDCVWADTLVIEACSITIVYLFFIINLYSCLHDWCECTRRLWAEVFHVSASGAGTVKWQQVSEDLVPVNITCIQDSPECVFHITAYNSQVDKILDVRLVQPGKVLNIKALNMIYLK